MHITNKVFLDSSFFTEGYKGKHLDFYSFFNTNSELECYINAIVCTEHWYNLLGLIGNTSPLTLKESSRIAATIANDALRFEFFRDFTVIDIGIEVIEAALVLMPKYNLLSNDALILASCIVHQIPFIASYDSDFEAACKGEKVQLVTPANYHIIFP